MEFLEGLKPFYAGFGNRETDAISYRYLGIPLDKCFIINTSSEVVQLGHTNKTTYQEIADNADKDFPKLNKKNEIEKIEENDDFKSTSNLINQNNDIISSQEQEGTITIQGSS